MVGELFGSIITPVTSLIETYGLVVLAMTYNVSPLSITSK